METISNSQYHKWLRLFEINHGYSEEKLREAYFRIAERYYPNLAQQENEEMRTQALRRLKNLTIIYETLQKVLSHEIRIENFQDNHRNYEVEPYHDRLVRKIKQEILAGKPSKYDFFNRELKGEWDSIWKNVNVFMANYYESKEEVDKDYNILVAGIQDFFLMFTRLYCQKNSINLDLTLDLINISQCKTFQELEICLEAAILENEKYRRFVDNEFHEFELREGYQYLKNRVEAIKAMALSSHLETDGTSTFIRDKKFELEFMFNEYAKISARFCSIRRFIESHNSQDDFIIKIKQLLEIYEEASKKDVLSKQTDKYLYELENLVKQYKERSQQPDEKAILTEITLHYQEALTYYAENNLLLQLQQVTELYNAVVGWFNIVKMQPDALEKLNLLRQVDFKNVESAKTLLQSLGQPDELGNQQKVKKANPNGENLTGKKV